MATMDLTRAAWHKSTRSSGNGNCVEVAVVDDTVGVRDTKNREGGMLVFTAAEWSAFLSGMKSGEFDLAD
jgi:Domain of unknown function (DUF397)